MMLSSVLTIVSFVLNAGIIYCSIRFIDFAMNNKVCVYLFMPIIVHMWSQVIYVKFTFEQQLPICFNDNKNNTDFLYLLSLSVI